jgi:ABC-2 type transport system ATP-binding protein
LEEVGEVCTRVIIIAKGRIVADDTPERLMARSALHGTIYFTIKTGDGKDVVQNVNSIPEIEKSEVVNESETEMTLRIFPKGTPAPPADLILHHLLEKGFSVETFFMEKGRLDEVFRMVTMPDSIEREV